MGLIKKKHRHHHHHHHHHRERIEISPIDEAAKSWKHEEDFRIEEIEDSPNSQRIDESDKIVNDNKSSDDSEALDFITESKKITEELFAPIDLERTEHHHHHHGKRKKRKKKKSLFHINREQKHYRKHKGPKKKKVPVQLIAVICIIVICAGILGMLIKISGNSKNQVAEETRKEDQAKRVDDKALEDDINSRFEQVEAAFKEYLPGFVCWGESLTAGSGGNGVTYPDVLEELINENLSSFEVDEVAKSNGGQVVGSQYYKLAPVKVVNMGASDENTATTLGRNGAVPFVLASDTSIPADRTDIELQIVSRDGEAVMPMRRSSAGMDYVVIGGVTGKLSDSVEETAEGKTDHFTFMRSQPGGEITLPAGTEIITSGSLENLNLIPIIFIGQNESYDSAEELIQQQRAIIAHQQLSESIKDRFIIIGQPFQSGKSAENIRTALEEEYGFQYIDVRDYMVSQGLADAGITATDEDKEQILAGEIPASLRSDTSHFNEVGYELLGKLVYQRMVMLGYFDEVEAAIQTAME